MCILHLYALKRCRIRRVPGGTDTCAGQTLEVSPEAVISTRSVRRVVRSASVRPATVRSSLDTKQPTCSPPTTLLLVLAFLKLYYYMVPRLLTKHNSNKQSKTITCTLYKSAIFFQYFFKSIFILVLKVDPFLTILFQCNMLFYGSFQIIFFFIKLMLFFLFSALHFYFS